MATAQLYWQIWLFLLFLLWGMGAWHWKPTAVGGGAEEGGAGLLLENKVIHKCPCL